jgi:hypothetical protein
MSHITQIKLEIKDLEALKTAAAMLELEYKEGVTKHKYYAGKYGKCDHVISVPGNKDAYEIGVVANPNGTYKLNWDSFAGGYGLVEKVGESAYKLKQEYGAAVAEKQLRRQGYRVKRQVVDGKLVLRGVN